jgi:integrase
VRETLLPDHLADQLRELAERRGNGLLWPSPRTGGYWSLTTISSRRIGAAMAAAGWPRLPNGRSAWTFHSLRHHAATWVLEELGAHVSQVSSVLGHAAPHTTWLMYVHSLPDASPTLAANSHNWRPPTPAQHPWRREH